ncbi:IPT/TIG domain-containing protein [Candidatus Kaiserbacteria bacterium]|nr:IPT/TIG domain-containing protein [Candidatus Kaiserbacteria bacterium]
MNKLLVSGLVAVVAFGATIASAQTYYPYSYGASYSGGCVNLTSDLSYGSRSGDVSNLQTFLVGQNFPGGGSWMITGYFGNATLAAVRNFQQQQGLQMTGIADAATRAAITRVSCGSYASAYPYLSYPYNYNYNFNTYPNQNVYPYQTGTLALTSMSQNTGAPGTSVTLYGTGFDAVNNTVYFGTQAIPGISSVNGTALTFTVPTYTAYSYNQTVQLYIANTRGSSNTLAFTVNAYPSYGCGYQGYQYGYQYGYNYNYNSCNQYQPPYNNIQSPAITYISPTSGAVGSSVTVFGSGFSTSGNTVHFGTGIITNLQSPDGHSVSFIVPSQLTGYGSQVVTLSTYQVFVTNSAGFTSNAVPFTVTSLGTTGVAPTITSVNGPTSLQPGILGTWTIQVSNPGTSYLTTTVNWGDTGTYGYSASQPQVVYSQGTQTLSFTHTYYQTGTYTVTFTVTNTSGQSNTTSATVSVGSSGSTNAVSLSSLAPSSGAVGTQVTIYGTGFSLGNTILFGTGAITNAYSQNGTTLVFTVPAYLTPYCAPNVYCAQYAQQVTPGQYNVSVQNQNGTSNSLVFRVI